MRLAGTQLESETLAEQAASHRLGGIGSQDDGQLVPAHINRPAAEQLAGKRERLNVITAKLRADLAGHS